MRSRPSRLLRMKPETVIIAMIAALFGIGMLTGGDDDEGKPSNEQRATSNVARVAHKLERIRKLRFKEIPPVRTVTPEEARAEGLELLDATYPPDRREADETVLRLLGLIPEDADLRDLFGTIFGEEVAGYYDEKKKQMTLVGAGVDEITLAHELTHALEDQHFGIGGDESELDDEASATQALLEGTATVAMLDYVRGPQVDRSQVLATLDLAEFLESGSDLPPYLQRSLVFPYAAGARFVDAIGTWGPANRALKGHPPVSTEQVMHPEKYKEGERPLHVDAGRSPGAGWKRAASGTIGEFDTGELIRSVDSPVRAERAARGWGGGAYELWQRGGRSILKLAWRWDTPLDAAEFVSALPRYIEERRADGVTVEVDTGEIVRLTIEAGG